MSKSRPEEMVEKFFNPTFNYADEYKNPELWEMRYKGRPIIVSSGKRVWNKKSHASSALRNHCDGRIRLIKTKLREMGYGYSTIVEVSDKIYRNWRDENIEFVRLK